MATLHLSPLNRKWRKGFLVFFLHSWVWRHLTLPAGTAKTAKPLSHPSLSLYSDLHCFHSFAKYCLISFSRKFLCSSKLGLHFNELVILPLGNQFLSTPDKSGSIRIQRIELELGMCFTYGHIHWFYTIPQCGQVGSWSALYPPIKNTKIYVCFTGMWVGFCQPA